GEAGSVIDLPVQAGVQHGRVLHSIGQATLVLAQIDPLGVVAGYSKLNAEKSAAGGCSHVDVNYPVAHFKIFYRRRSTVEQQALAALIVGHAGFSLEQPTIGVGGKGKCLRRLRISREHETQLESENGQSAGFHGPLVDSYRREKSRKSDGCPKD